MTSATSANSLDGILFPCFLVSLRYGSILEIRIERLQASRSDARRKKTRTVPCSEHTPEMSNILERS